MKVLSVEHVKSLIEQSAGQEIKIPASSFLSRKAVEFIRNNHIHVNQESTEEKKEEKKEYMTSLSGKEMVVKTHPRIVFRGKLDTFQAEILKTQILAEKYGDDELLRNLEELLGYCRNILTAEVLDKPTGECLLFGMKEDELRCVSHHPKTYIGVGHVPPDFHMGEICIELNLLRAKSRELEIAGVQAFYTKNRAERNDILTALNRLSSAIYILYCRYLSKRNWGQL